jgi:hypothetical protein
MDPFTMMMLGNSVGGLFSDLFNNPSMPYQNAGNQYQKWAQMGANTQNPFMQAGQGAIPGYQNWMKGMSNPSQYVNSLMNNYQESPNAKFMQQQAMRGAQNAGSASGMQGSTPLALQMQQNAGNISQQDMGNWMNNAMGVNQMYGGAMGNMMNMGQQSANALTNLYSNEANSMGDMTYGEGEAQNQNNSNIFSDLF